ncbi:hypothetical protein ASJ82_01185 [Methanosphaera cuniculi]|uniref:Uncharacterized protein n=1 Tax=Methanosphaera cuniculi TaxID=1077256 RepID=A0A2A2HFL9_9EURY|nr:hypothetical protein ASJ82_01185 [Methanosphaera cuniculi]
MFRWFFLYYKIGVSFLKLLFLYIFFESLHHTINRKRNFIFFLFDKIIIFNKNSIYYSIPKKIDEIRIIKKGLKIIKKK